MYELSEWLIFAGRLLSMTVGFIGGVLAMLTMMDWAMGRIGRHVKAYAMLIEFALRYRDFKRYLADRSK